MFVRLHFLMSFYLLFNMISAVAASTQYISQIPALRGIEYRFEVIDGSLFGGTVSIADKASLRAIAEKKLTERFEKIPIIPSVVRIVIDYIADSGFFWQLRATTPFIYCETGQYEIGQDGKKHIVWNNDVIALSDQSAGGPFYGICNIQTVTGIVALGVTTAIIAVCIATQQN